VVIKTLSAKPAVSKLNRLFGRLSRPHIDLFVEARVYVPVFPLHGDGLSPPFLIFRCLCSAPFSPLALPMSDPKKISRYSRLSTGFPFCQFSPLFTLVFALGPRKAWAKTSFLTPCVFVRLHVAVSAYTLCRHGHTATRQQHSLFSRFLRLSPP